MELNLNDIQKMFPDWRDMKLGTWSNYSKVITNGSNRSLEVGLYREPLDNDEYSGRYTLQIFDGDNVIFCSDIDMQN